MFGMGPLSDGAIAEAGFVVALSLTAFEDATEAGNMARDKGQVYIVQLQPAEIGDPPVIQNLGYSDAGYIAPRTGSLADTAFEGRVSQPLHLSWAIPVVPEGARRVSLESVDIEIVNADGAFDGLVDGADIGGRGIQVLFGLRTYPYDWFQPIFSGTGVVWSRDFTKLSITARDRGYLLDKALQTATYSGAGGINGGDENANKRRPLCFGKVRNIAPILIDISNNVYQLHSRLIFAVDAVRDKGAALTSDSDYPDYAALVAAVIASGHYATCLAQGLIRLGATPVGTVTADAHGDAVSGLATTTIGVVRRLLLDFAGVNAGELDADAFDAFDAAVDGLVGWYQGQDSTVTVHDAVEEIVGHCGGWWGVTPLGLYTVGLLLAPDSGASEQDYTLGDIEDVEIIDPPQGAMPPRWRQNVAYQRNWTVQQASELAGSVAPADVAAFSTPYLVASANDPDISATYLLAQDSAVLQSLFDMDTAATATANRLLGLLGSARQALRLTVNEVGLRISRGATVSLTVPRINGGAQKFYRYIGAEIDASKRRVAMLLWG